MKTHRKKLAKEINALEEEIKLLETRRARSQASIMDSLINGTTPIEVDVQFFRTFTAEIEVKRKQLQQLIRQLEDNK